MKRNTRRCLQLCFGIACAGMALHAWNAEIPVAHPPHDMDRPISPSEVGETDLIKSGVRLWSDRDYVATVWPAPLTGHVFARSSINGSKVTINKSGYALAVTPVAGQAGGFSEEKALKEAGFTRFDIEPFVPFTAGNANGDTCCVYQKKVEPGETVSHLKYCVLLWAADPLPPSINKALPDSEAASRVTPPNPPNKGILFVDHSLNSRSGHLGHALVEYQPGQILAFYPNCSDDMEGHSAVGWMEFKRSEDAGKTWESPQVLPFSKELFQENVGRTAMAEKALVTNQGEIVLFYLICDTSKDPLWQPYWVPLVSRSIDAGKTWTAPEPVCSSRGRIYDAKYQDGEIRVLHFANDATKSWWGSTDEHIYELHVSSDGGKTFSKRSVVPLVTKDRGYGSIGQLANGDMIVYVYNRLDEFNLDYVTSPDGGRTWSKVNTARFSRKIRNPQFIAFDGKYYMHGRSGADGEGSGNMILYMSPDGVHWDNGIYLRTIEAGMGAYSNSIIVHDKTKSRLLIQASHAYRGNRTNVLHWWLD